jgi:hypothetical protein
MYVIHIHIFSYGSFQQDCGSLNAQTNIPCYRVLAFNVVWTLSTFFNSISIITNCTYGPMSKSNIIAYISNLFTFFK